MKAVELQVMGKVQGVFYRASTQQMACDLQLVGWVKNEKDGSVRMHIQGPDDAVDKMTDWARQGPKYARVSHVAATEVAPGAFDRFDVIR